MVLTTGKNGKPFFSVATTTFLVSNVIILAIHVQNSCMNVKSGRGFAGCGGEYIKSSILLK